MPLWALFVFAPETGDVQRITYGLSEIDPTVLADGRILYSQWQPGGDGRPDEGAFGIFAVHPDGSGVTAVHGYHDGPRWKLRPTELANGDLLFLGGEQVEALGLRRFDPRAPGAPSQVVSPPTGVVPGAFGRWGSGLLVAVAGGGLHAVLGESSELLAAEIEASEVAGAQTRKRPQGHISGVKTELGHGQIFGIDARAHGFGNAERLRFVALAAGGDSEGSIGEVMLAKDGSFFVELPANRPLLFELLDGAGRILVASRTPIWIRPGEKRGCVGCHEDPEVAPPNRRPLAVLEEAVDLVGGGR